MNNEQLPMRGVSNIILVVVIAIGVCIILAVVIIGRLEFDGKERVQPIGWAGVVLVEDGGSWPMFRGGQRLLGRAPGALPDSMALVWKFKTDGAVKSSPAIDDGLVFIGSDDGNIYAIDLRTGGRVWAYETGDAVEAAPCVVDGSVFVGSSDTFLYAIDAKSGSLKWKYETDAQILGAANWTRSPDGQWTWILVGSYDNKLYCLDSANGEVVWTYETDSYINGSPAVGEGKVIFGGCDAMIHVVAVADGSKVTQIDTGSFIAASAAIFEGRVYVGNYDNVFINVEIASAPYRHISICSQ